MTPYDVVTVFGQSARELLIRARELPIGRLGGGPPEVPHTRGRPPPRSATGPDGRGEVLYVCAVSYKMLRLIV